MISYAVGAGGFLAWGLLTLDQTWSGHVRAASGCLIVAVGLTVLSGRLRAGHIRRILDQIWIWAVLGLAAGSSVGLSLGKGADYGWRFITGVIVGALIVGALRWHTSVALHKSPEAEEANE